MINQPTIVVRRSLRPKNRLELNHPYHAGPLGRQNVPVARFDFELEIVLAMNVVEASSAKQSWTRNLKK